MVFNSFHFLFFYIAAVAVYFALPHRWRWVFLLAGSYYFYMCWRPAFVVLLWATTLIDYSLARAIAASSNEFLRRIYLLLSIVTGCSVLFTFKYLNFVAVSLNTAFDAFNIFAQVPLFDLLLPVGISFYTFQSLSYVIDVYRRATPVERHLGIFALYVVFFPQLVAGPIERSNNLLPQFYRRKKLTFVRVRDGLRLAMWGVFKKMAIADLLSPFVDQVYANPAGQPGILLIIATLFFAVQIYCDFSGYSDIAIGIARIMGFDLMTNFRQPYFSASVAEFWRRWHISLSTWFRDYIYYPLGGNRVDPARWTRNILAVFIISGIWHGANWTFIVWGALHGVLLLLESTLRNVGAALSRLTGLAHVPRVHLALRIGFTFCLILLTWVFFRAQNLDDARYILTHLHDWSGFELPMLWKRGLPRFEVVLAFVLIGTLFTVEYCLFFRPALITALWNRRPIRWACYSACTYGVIFFGVFDRVSFIYFQF
jgi:alginate O-acetyltransferase complex protein AlgI